MLGQEINTNLFQGFPINKKFQFLAPELVRIQKVILLELTNICWGPSELYLSSWTDEQSERLTGQQSVLIKADAFCTRSPLPFQNTQGKSGTPTFIL